MTEYEIVKALECCSKHQNSCGKNCPLDSICSNVRDCLLNLSKNALDLINRQKAEIEKLEKEKDSKIVRCIANDKDKIKSEAIKEFAHFIIDRSKNGVICTSDIPDLVKEMTEGNKNDRA